MASEHSSSGPALHEMTPVIISSRLVPNIPPSTSFVPPSKSDWDILFQPLFDELLTPLPSFDHPAPEVIALINEVVAPEPAASTDLPSTITVDQDAPSPSNSQTKPKTQYPIIPNDVEKDNHDLDVAHMNNNPFFGSSTNIIGELARPVSTRMQLHEQALLCYYDAFLTAVKPKMYKDALTQSCWIEAMQEELNEFKHLEAIRIFLAFTSYMNMVVYQMDMKTMFLNGNLREEVYVSQLDRFVDTNNPNHVYKLKKALYRLKQAPCAWYDMLSSFLISQDFSRGLVDHTLFMRRDGKELLLPVDLTYNLLYACAPGIRLGLPKSTYMRSKGSFDTRHSTSSSMQFLGDRLVRWSSKRQKSVVISSTKAECITLSGCYAQVLWMRSQLIDYGLGFNKIPMYCDN
nr:copia protein [Tanacetum cinerariifolium]